MFQYLFTSLTVVSFLSKFDHLSYLTSFTPSLKVHLKGAFYTSSYLIGKMHIGYFKFQHSYAGSCIK